MKSALEARAGGGSDPIRRPDADSPRVAKLRAAAQLRHPHLVEMSSSGADAPKDPVLHGGLRLSELSRKRFGSGPVPLGYGLRILLDTLSGLAALHGTLQFAHGEVAPRNIVVGRDGTSRLIPVVTAHWQDDASPDSEAAGYAAPERLRGDPFDHRADVFGAGVMLWELITGRSFRGLPAETIAAWVVDGKVPDPVHPDDAPW